MAVRTHDSSWRYMVSFAPLLGLVIVAGTALQEGREILESPIAMAILGGVAAVGTLVAWRTTYQLRAVVITTVASAQPGQVSLRGLAQALPGATPLLSPEGASCLWFYHREIRSRSHQVYKADSVRPFLLVDDTGQCIVLPAGAQITGDSKSHENSDSDERRLLEGDRIHVVGRFIPISGEAIDAQLEAVQLARQTEQPRVSSKKNDKVKVKRVLAEDPLPAAASPAPAAPLNLPVVAKPSGAQPFIISIDSKESEGGYYELAAVINTLVLCVAGCTYLLLTAGL